MQFVFTAENNRTTKTFSWLQKVGKEENILEKGYLHLQNQMVGESKVKEVPMYRVYDRYAITGIKTLPESKVVKCSGCLGGQPNQLAHIDCPDGCLHDIIECGCQDCDL